MDTILALMIEWPKWAVYAVVGGLLGSLAGSAGWLLERTGLKWGRFAVILGIAATPVVSREIVLPAIINAYTNQELPMVVDEYTTLTQIEYAGKRYVYHYDLSPDVDADFDVQEVKSMGLDGMCDYWSQSFQEGEVISAEYRYNLHGQTRSFLVSAKDC